MANWAAVAGEAGYFDQAHLIREFRNLTGETPVAFTASGNRPLGDQSGSSR